MNSIGTIFRLTSFGESHGAGIGGVVDGMPAGIVVDEAFIQSELDRRRPGQSRLTTARKEGDRVELLSGVAPLMASPHSGATMSALASMARDGELTEKTLVTTGCPIGFLVRNTDHHSSDYDDMRDVLRPSHADYTYMAKYGIRDHRGGGRSSARETISRVVAGALAKTALRQLGITVTAYTSQVGDLRLAGTYQDYDLSLAESNDVRCPDPVMAERMARLIMQVKGEGDTIGGVITCVVTGCPAGLGSPVFGKLHADLGHAMLTINAVKGFEYGEGFAGVTQRGSEQNDLPLPHTTRDGETDTTDSLHFATNHSGGIQGGISNGEPIVMRIAFKPVATLLREQDTVDIHGHSATLRARGRHDPCVLPRAVPIVEAMAACVLLDHYLMNKTTHL